MCKMAISPSAFFFILIFWFVRGVKSQKLAQNEKQNLRPSRVLSQEQCII